MGMYGRTIGTTVVARHNGTDIVCGPSMTKQAFADETDINKIIARFEKTGMLTSVNSREPFYGDVSEISDYQSALETVREADVLFMQMSADIRNRFDNDAQKMIEFLADRANLDEAVKLGMAVKRPVVPVEPPLIPQVSPTPIVGV